MNKNQETIFFQALDQIRNDNVSTEDRIKQLVEFYRILNPITDDEAEDVIKELHANVLVRIDRGYFIKEKNHVPWYYNSVNKQSDAYWNRYKKYLSKCNLPLDVINKLDQTTDDIMDLLGNPNSDLLFKRRGLIIGDVQSGKTSTYTGLINKAADSGYKVIIILTGTIEKLRQQTQARLDEGFIGFDSRALNKDKIKKVVGVGEYSDTSQAWSMTTVDKDFNSGAAQQHNGQLTNLTVPVLFVLKKNKSVLEKLEKWLRVCNRDRVCGKVLSPLLLIDDEADNASVNTRDENSSPTAINYAIRKLLDLFARSNYVGFTATPYANIFINPDTADAMIGDELFPEDFIYALPSSSEYIGAKDIYPDDSKYHYMLRSNNDCDAYIPLKSRKTDHIQDLPPSLKKAIASFFIINAIRDLRGDNGSHRTMLINVSRLIVIQNIICDKVYEYVKTMNIEIENYSKVDSANEHEIIKFLRDVYKTEFCNRTINSIEYTCFTWEQILGRLSDSCKSIMVKTVNGGNSQKNLDYDSYKENGMRLIAVGGLSLSRGLTLEGLCVSYFHRNSKMYDTLMQMGRWFGYRKNYADLCQIWMTSDSVEWYKDISESTEELKDEVRLMSNSNMTPKDYGLGVRTSQNAILVTALSKMRNSEEVVLDMQVGGKVIETPCIDVNTNNNDANYATADIWVRKLVDNGYFASEKQRILKNGSNSKCQFFDVPSNYIKELLESLYISKFSENFQTESLIKLIEEDSSLGEWDVVIAEGEGPTRVVGGLSIQSVNRKFDVFRRHGLDVIRLSGSSKRLGSTSFAKCGLSRTQVKVIETEVKKQRIEEKKNKKFSQDDYFKYDDVVKRNPLLVLYNVHLNNNASISDENNNNNSVEELDKISRIMGGFCVGIALGIPGNRTKIIKIKYRVNQQKFYEIHNIDRDDFENEET